MFHRSSRTNHGSGLILSLGILALLAVMATTFITLMRINTRLSRVYTDEFATELLAAGVENYCLAVLQDDQDRTLYKYENRDQAVGGRDRWQGMGNYSSGDSAAETDFRMSIPGRNTDWWAASKNRYATVASNDVWYHSASDGYVETALYDASAGHREWPQSSFGGESYDFCIVDKNDCVILDPVQQNQLARYYAYVSGNHNGLDDDMDGWTDPNYMYGANGDPPVVGWYFPDAGYNEVYALTRYHHDSAYFLTHGRSCHLHPGGKLTGAFRLPGGASWRWAAKMGVPEERYVNLNAAGNVFRTASYLNNMDGRDLHAVNGDSTTSAEHLGLLSWRGYPGEYFYESGTFPSRFNAVQYSPYQIDPYRAVGLPYHSIPYRPTDSSNVQTYCDEKVDPTRAERAAPELVRARWGPDGVPADGNPRWRIGWRRDGATYYKLPSPDNPMGDDHYFGAAEAFNHQSEDIVPGTSRVLGAMLTAANGDVNQARLDFGRARGYLSTSGCDTILRGKIWPGEGYAYPGDWRHIDILRKININMIGAKGGENLPGEDGTVKTLWANRRVQEQQRLYYMVKAMLDWSGTPSASHEACQLVASLADMVDRDHEETYYPAPDGSANWALGVEKHPVLNEVVFYSKSAANTPNYELFRIRVELYNPWENIPWIPDADEAFDISDYILKIAGHAYPLADLTRYTTDPNVPMGLVSVVPKIGADGMYGDPFDGTAEKLTWSRFAHLGWASNWPPGLTRLELEGTDFSGVTVELWKPLYGDADLHVPVTPGKVEMVNNRKCVLVDRTPSMQLVRPYGGTTGLAGPASSYPIYLGIYRRWDPMNARIYEDVDAGVLAGLHDKSNLLWCPRWNLGNFPTLGRPNTEYPANASTTAPPGSGTSPYGYDRVFEVNYKMPDGDLPSVGWLGELFQANCAQDGPLTWVHSKAQRPIEPNAWQKYYYSNILETAKLDLFRPWDKIRNLHLYDMFTVWDPMHDGIDNDRDGAIDEADTGCQAGDLGGPEVRVYGTIDVNHCGGRILATLWPGQRVPAVYGLQDHGVNRERAHSTHVSSDWVCYGPRDSIGDMLLIDDVMLHPGSDLGRFTTGGSAGVVYKSSRNLTTGNYWGSGMYGGYDDDGDGITDERDERDFWFTQAANFMTTRSNTFTIEIVAQIAEAPYYPGRKFRRGAYKSLRVYSQKHLILLADRSSTLRIDPYGRCDFTGPVRVLARRWGHERK